MTVNVFSDVYLEIATSSGGPFTPIGSVLNSFNWGEEALVEDKGGTGVANSSVYLKSVRYSPTMNVDNDTLVTPFLRNKMGTTLYVNYGEEGNATGKTRISAQLMIMNAPRPMAKNTKSTIDVTFALAEGTTVTYDVWP